MLLLIDIFSKTEIVFPYFIRTSTDIAKWVLFLPEKTSAILQFFSAYKITVSPSLRLQAQTPPIRQLDLESI